MIKLEPLRQPSRFKGIVYLPTKEGEPDNLVFIYNEEHRLEEQGIPHKRLGITLIEGRFRLVWPIEEFLDRYNLPKKLEMQLKKLNPYGQIEGYYPRFPEGINIEKDIVPKALNYYKSGRKSHAPK